MNWNHKFFPYFEWVKLCSLFSALHSHKMLIWVWFWALHSSLDDITSRRLGILFHYFYIVNMFTLEQQHRELEEVSESCQTNFNYSSATLFFLLCSVSWHWSELVARGWVTIESHILPPSPSSGTLKPTRIMHSITSNICALAALSTMKVKPKWWKKSSNSSIVKSKRHRWHQHNTHNSE